LIFQFNKNAQTNPNITKMFIIEKEIVIQISKIRTPFEKNPLNNNYPAELNFLSNPFISLFRNSPSYLSPLLQNHLPINSSNNVRINQ